MRAETAPAPGPSQAPDIRLRQVVAAGTAPEPGFDGLRADGAGTAWTAHLSTVLAAVARLPDDPADPNLVAFLPGGFTAQTGVTAAELQARVRLATAVRAGPVPGSGAARAPGSAPGGGPAGAAQADVLPLARAPQQAAFFLNVFEQGELFHRGLAALAADAAQALALPLPQPPAATPADIGGWLLGTDFIARPAFWHAWRRLVLRIVALGDDDAGWRRRLHAPLPGGPLPAGALLAERAGALLLLAEPHWRSLPLDGYSRARWGTPALQADPTDALASDALKHALLQTGWTEFAAVFSRQRERVFKRERARLEPAVVEAAAPASNPHAATNVETELTR